MRERDDAFGELREALDAFAVEQAKQIVVEARAEAIAKVRSMLAEAMTESLLYQIADQIGPERKVRPHHERTAPGRPDAPMAESSGESKLRGRSPQRKPEPKPELGYYVYGIVWANEAELSEDISGVDPSHRATVVRHEDGLAAITSLVSLSEFGEDELRENLNDVEWLEEKARAHERVLDEALARMTVVPLRLCTIYRSEAQVHEMLSSEEAIFVEALGRLKGHTEWGVKLVAEPDAIDRAAESDNPDQTEAAELAAGAAYMRERGRQARARELRDEIAEDWAQVVHEALAERASEALRNPLQNPELSGETGEMLLNGVYLVDDDHIDAFRQTVDELDGRFQALGGSVELTGPWPPYNFVKGSIEAAR